MEKLDEARAREERKRKAMKAKRQAALAKSATKTAAPNAPVFVAAPPLASPEPPPVQAKPVAKTGAAAGSKASGAKAPASKAPASKAPPAKAPATKAPETKTPAPAKSPEARLKSRQEAEAEISALLDAREQRARRRLGLSFLFVVIVPTLVAALYLALLATPRYLAEAKFIVRGTLEMLGGESTRFSRDLSALSSISNNQEGHILVDHVTSHAAVERLLERMDLYAIYRIKRETPESAPTQDPAFNRLMATWRSMVRIGMDSVTGILTLDVQAYTAEDAMNIAQALLDESTKLVNELTARARQDRLKRATEEVTLSRAELDGLLKQFEAFRNKQGTVDANYSALALEGLAGLLRDQRIKLNSELTTARASMGADAAPVRTLATRLEALDGEIANLEAQIDGTTRRASLERAAVPQSLAVQEQLETKRDLAIARVTRAEGAQSTALSDTLRQHAFLMIFEPPFLPHLATFPQVRLDTLITFLVMFGFWCIGATFTRNLHVHS